MQPTFVLFSGLPGTGKSTLANRLARDIHWPLMGIDNVATCLKFTMDSNTVAFWDKTITALLLLCEAQLKLGVSVIADSIFMNLDRFHAQAIARQTGARFLPIYTFLSNEAIWEQRVTARSQTSNQAEWVASWTQVLSQRKDYHPWEPGTALFVDAINPLDENYGKVWTCVCKSAAEFLPLGEVPFTPGKYHG